MDHFLEEYGDVLTTVLGGVISLSLIAIVLIGIANIWTMVVSVIV